jgi:hypothetical protein
LVPIARGVPLVALESLRVEGATLGATAAGVPLVALESESAAFGVPLVAEESETAEWLGRQAATLARSRNAERARRERMRVTRSERGVRR